MPKPDRTPGAPPLPPRKDRRLPDRTAAARALRATRPARNLPRRAGY